jgi:hypothetical protein
MIIYFVYSTPKALTDERLMVQNKKDTWGLLLSYKEISGKSEAPFDKILNLTKGEDNASTQRHNRRKS